MMYYGTSILIKSDGTFLVEALGGHAVMFYEHILGGTFDREEDGFGLQVYSDEKYAEYGVVRAYCDDEEIFFKESFGMMTMEQIHTILYFFLPYMRHQDVKEVLQIMQEIHSEREVWLK